MRSKTMAAVAVAALLGVGRFAPPARADAKHATKDTVKEGAKTSGYAVRDGARTVGRATKALFKSGPAAARQAWHRNAATTGENARQGAARTRAATNE